VVCNNFVEIPNTIKPRRRSTCNIERCIMFAAGQENLCICSYMHVGLRSRPLHLHVVKPGNPSSMEPSQRRNDNHAEHYCYDNQRCLSSTISEHKTKHGISITSIRLARKACDEGSPPPAGRSLGCMNLSCPPPLKSCRFMDKGGIHIGQLDHGYLPHPTTMRKVIQDVGISEVGM
jgi:hypothetical protein